MPSFRIHVEKSGMLHVEKGTVKSPMVGVIDDDPAYRAWLDAVLQSQSWSVVLYDSADEFLRSLDRGQCDCLIIDLMMSDMTGLELHERLIENGYDLPVIVVTAHGNVATAVRALQRGATDFIEKPCEPRQLLSSVRRVLDRRAGQREQLLLRNSIAARYASLTPRERQVLGEMLLGQSNKVIAARLDLSTRTVEVHRARILDKMQARNLSELMRMALATGVGLKSVV